jgi:hypothetical protein
MKYVAAILASVLGVLVVAAPASAHHKSDHHGGPDKGLASHSEKNKPNKDEKHGWEDQLKSDASQHSGLHLGQRVHSLIDNQANELADELEDCTTDDNLREMRLGQIKHLAHAAGLSTGELKDLLGSDTHRSGLGWLIRNGLESDEAEDLEDALRDGLESSDLQQLSVGRLLQAAHACGLTTSELVELLRDN